jgi:synaptobrevin family protein YKT6
MKLISIILFNASPKTAAVLSYCFELSSFGFWGRSSVKEFCFFASRELIERSGDGRQTVKYNQEEVEYRAHCYKTNNVGCVVLTDEEYQPRIAHDLIRKVMESAEKKFNRADLLKYEKDTFLAFPEMDSIFKNYQNPQEADKILTIKRELDLTKEIVHRNIEALMKEGERLEELAQKSQDLSFQSKAFMKQSKELTKCCRYL